MKFPIIQVQNRASDTNEVHLVIYQSAKAAGWAKVTAWKVAGLAQNSSADIDIPEDYNIKLEYVRNEARIETKTIPVYDGIGSFKIKGDGDLIELIPEKYDPESGRLDINAERNFRGPVKVIISKGAERIFPAVEMGPGFEMTPNINGDFHLAVSNQIKIGADFAPEFATPSVKVVPGDRVVLTGSRKKGYQLKTYSQN